MQGFWSNPVALQELYFCRLLAKTTIFIDIVSYFLFVCVCFLSSSISFSSHKPYLERYRASSVVVFYPVFMYLNLLICILDFFFFCVCDKSI